MSKSPPVELNTEVLKWARSTLRLSVADAADLVGVSESLLRDWEEGIVYPSFAQLKKIANAYKRTTAVFLLPAIPKEDGVPTDYRVLDDKSAAKLQPSTLIEIRKAQKKRDYALELLRLSGQKIKNFEWKTTLGEDSEKLGNEWRHRFGLKNIQSNSYWKDDYEALNFWKKSIEELGVLIFQASLESLDELRGLAVYHKQLPMILLNTKDAPRGRIFSLLHEFCHLLLQRSGIGNMEPSFKKKDEFNSIEVFCNAFAAGCLLPTNLLLKEPVIINLSNGDDIKLAMLDRLSKKHQVSWEVILRRLLTVGKISQARYNETRSDIQTFYANQKKAEGGFADYITKMVSYNGEPFISLVLDSFISGNISVSEASDFLGMKTNHFSKLQGQLQTKKRRA